MRHYKFTWPYQIYAPLREATEEAMSSFITRAAPAGTFCHEWAVEVDIARNVPMQHRYNAVLLCACGKVCATLESTSEQDSWKLYPIDRDMAVSG